MSISAHWYDFKNKKLFTNIQCNKQTKVVTHIFCKGITQWVFMTHGPILKTKNSSPTPLVKNYLQNFKLE